MVGLCRGTSSSPDYSVRSHDIGSNLAVKRRRWVHSFTLRRPAINFRYSAICLLFLMFNISVDSVSAEASAFELRVLTILDSK